MLIYCCHVYLMLSQWNFPLNSILLFIKIQKNMKQQKMSNGGTIVLANKYYDV